jgi:hypothetical protein
MGYRRGQGTCGMRAVVRLGQALEIEPGPWRVRRRERYWAFSGPVLSLLLALLGTNPLAEQLLLPHGRFLELLFADVAEPPRSGNLLGRRSDLSFDWVGVSIGQHPCLAGRVETAVTELFAEVLAFRTRVFIQVHFLSTVVVDFPRRFELLLCSRISQLLLGRREFPTSSRLYHLV